MTATTAAAAGRDAAGDRDGRRVRPPLGHRVSRWLGANAVRLYAVVAFGYLFVPIAYTVAFSFNDYQRTNLVWHGFTLDNWKDPCGAPEFCSALGNSFKIGLLATLVATVLGTMVAFALARYRFHGRAVVNSLIFLPMATAEVVMGASLLALFLSLSFPLGFSSVVIAHVMFCLSFVVVTVKARLAGLDPSLEQAAMDLYATEWQTFRRVTLPLAMPGIVSGALLAFSLSFDDFIITNFNRGEITTFPVQVYVSAQRGVPAQANVIGTSMFVLALLVVVVAQLVNRRRRSF